MGFRDFFNDLGGIFRTGVEAVTGGLSQVMGGIFESPAQRPVPPRDFWGAVQGGQAQITGWGEMGPEMRNPQTGAQATVPGWRGQWIDPPQGVLHGIGRGIAGGLGGLVDLCGEGGCFPQQRPGQIPGGQNPTQPRTRSSWEQVFAGAPRPGQQVTPGSGPQSSQMYQAGFLPSWGTVAQGAMTGADMIDRNYPGGFGGAAGDLFSSIYNWATSDRPMFPQLGTGGAMAFLPGGAQVGQSQVGRPYGGMVFRDAPMGPRARSTLQIQNPYTGQTMFYKNMGRPILFTGDLSAAKRVRRAASRARRGR